MPHSSSDKPAGLFDRWSQRRQLVAEEAEAEKSAELTKLAEQVVLESDGTASADETVATPSTVEVDSLAQPPQDDPTRQLTAADLPDPEQIEVGGSFARFMANNVDPAAKTAALRALWKQPHFNEIDGLLEYALDYSNQPKLSPEVSAELAKKIFRHVVKEEPEESLDEMDMAQVPAVEALAPEITEVKHEQTEMVSNLTSDNLDGQSDELPQNEPELTTNVHSPVV